MVEGRISPETRGLKAEALRIYTWAHDKAVGSDLTDFGGLHACKISRANALGTAEALLLKANGQEHESCCIVLVVRVEL